MATAGMSVDGGVHGAAGAGRARERALQLGLLAAVALLVVATLYVFRALDDNRLVSWHWVFAGADPLRFGLLVLGAVAAAAAFGGLRLGTRATVAGLCIVAYAAGAWLWRAPEVIVDAARYFTQAKHLALYGVAGFLGDWGGELAAWTDLPLVPFLYGLVFVLSGEERLAVQAFTTACFAGTVALTYLIGKTLWDETLGVHAAAFLLAMPYLLTQVALMLADVPTMFFLALALFALLRALAHGGPWIAAAAAATATALLAKYSAWFVLAAALPAALLYRGRPGAVRLARAAAVVALAAALLAPFIAAKHELIVAQLALLYDYQAPGLGRWRESLVSTFLFQIHPFVTVTALLSLIVAWRRRDPRYAVLGAPWLVLLVLGAGRIRYLLPLFPLLALMAAYGLALLRDVRLARLVVWCAVATSVTIAAFGYLPFLRQTSAANLEHAGAYLDRLEGQTVEVYTLPQTAALINPAVSVPLLDFYTRKRLVYRNADTQPPPGFATSSLRFTWEAPPPRYYNVSDAAATVVVIAAARDQALPAPVAARLNGASLAASFDRSEGVYGYQTLVAVYRHAQAN